MGRAVVGRRLLIIDADSISRRVLKTAYGMRGHTVRVAATAAEGLEAMMAETPEVVLYDWYFRDDTAIGLAKKLRAAAAPAQVAVLTVTVIDEPDGFREREGVDDYMVKPVLAETVERAFEEALERINRGRRP